MFLACVSPIGPRTLGTTVRRSRTPSHPPTAAPVLFPGPNGSRELPRRWKKFSLLSLGSGWGLVLGRRKKSGKGKKLSRPSKVSEKGDCPQGSLTGHVSPAFNFLVGSRTRFVGITFLRCWFYGIQYITKVVLFTLVFLPGSLHQVYHSAAPAGALSR